MPILNIDQFGNFYETDPDSSEGLGYKGATPRAEGGDLSLGGAYMAAENERQQIARTLAYAESMRDQRDIQLGKFRRVQKAKQRIVRDMAGRMGDNPDYRDYLMKKGLAQTNAGIINEPLPLSGHGLSSNGLIGENNELPPAQVIAVDPTEMRQAQLQNAIERQVGIDAQKRILDNKLGAAPAQPMKRISQTVRVPARRAQPQNIHHPLAIFVVKP